MICLVLDPADILAVFLFSFHTLTNTYSFLLCTEKEKANDRQFKKTLIKPLYNKLVKLKRTGGNKMKSDREYTELSGGNDLEMQPRRANRTINSNSDEQENNCIGLVCCCILVLSAFGMGVSCAVFDGCRYEGSTEAKVGFIASTNVLILSAACHLLSCLVACCRERPEPQRSSFFGRTAPNANNGSATVELVSEDEENQRDNAPTKS